MSRPLRIEYPGAIYHITSRGNARQKIFLKQADYNQFLFIFKEIMTRYNWTCYAYCLMPNHYHLLVETPDGNLSQGMRQLNGIYTQKFNFIHKRVGHLFQGRYKAILVEKDGYLTELIRYIGLNAVRAKLVKMPEQWKWSSHREMLSKKEKDFIICRDKVISIFENISEYKKFIRQKTEEINFWEDLKGGIVLGSAEFVDKINNYIQPDRKLTKNIPRRERYVSRPKLSEIFNNDISDKKERNENIYKAHFNYGYTLTEIGDNLGLHVSVVSRAFKKIMNNKAKNKT